MYTEGMKINITDGGREAAGYKGSAGDCVTRAIAIATERNYQEVYDEVWAATEKYGETRRDRDAKKIQSRGGTPRNGVMKKVTKEYLTALGWKWTPTMGIGTGCKIHLRDGELPMGRLIVSVSKHLVAVIDGVINDTYDCSREGTRCVYGFWTKAA